MFHLMLGSEKDEHRVHPCMCPFGFKCWWLVCWLPAPNWDLEEATEVRPLLGSGECWVQEKQNFLGDACKRQQEWPRELVDQWHSYGKDWVSVIIYEKRWREEQEVKNIVEPGQNLCWSCFCCHGVYESWLDALFLVFKKHREKPNKRLRKIIVCGCPAFLEKRLLKHLDLFFFENSIEWGKFQRKEERDPKCASRGPQREWNLPGESELGKQVHLSAGHAEQILKPSAGVYLAPALSLSSQHIHDVY